MVDTSYVKEILKKFAEAPGVSGYEDGVREVIKSEVSRYVDEVRVDRIGNLICVKKGKGKGKVMLVAHMDEIGLVVRYIDEKGYIHVAPVGGVDPRLLLSSRVVIWGSGGPVEGVVGVKPIHLLSEEERRRVPSWQDIVVDIGASSREEASKYVSVGDVVTLEKRFVELMNGQVAVRAADDRAGCAVLAAVAKEIANEEPEMDIYLVFSAQEEVGGRGAKVATFNIKPDIVIAIDVTHAVMPGVEERVVAGAKVGEGPTISLGPPVNAKLSKFLIKVAEECKVKYQLMFEEGRTRTDMDIAQIEAGGAIATLVSIPNKYMHTTVEVVSIDDIAAAASILYRAVLKLRGVSDFMP